MTRPSRNTTIGGFVLNNDATFPWTVYVHVPNASGTGKDRVKFKAIFKHVTPERRLQLLEDFQAQIRERERLSSIPDQDKSDADIQTLREALSFERMLLEEVVPRFDSGILDGEGNDISQAEGTRGGMFANSWARSALLQAYEQALQGRAAEGN